MRAADLTTAAVLFLLGAVVLFDAVRLGIGWGTDGPKSGFFPFWLAALMMAACVAIAAHAARREASRPFVTREQLSPVLKVLWPAVAMVAATEVVGMYVAADVGHHPVDLALLGRALRWRDHVDPLQHSGRAVVRGHHVRLLSARAAGAERAGADRGLHVVVRRRALLHRAHHAVRAAARG